MARIEELTVKEGMLVDPATVRNPKSEVWEPYETYETVLKEFGRDTSPKACNDADVSDTDYWMVRRASRIVAMAMLQTLCNGNIDAANLTDDQWKVINEALRKTAGRVAPD
jgi:predicted acetyltransferase